MRLVLTIGAILLVARPVAGDARVETLDARSLRGQVLSISGKEVTLQAAEGKRALRLTDVAEMVFGEPADPMAKAGQDVLVTGAGDVIAAGDVMLDGGRLRLETPMLGTVELSLAAARTIYLAGAGQSAAESEQCYAQMKLREAPTDRLLVTRKGQEPLTVDGVLERIDTRNVTIQYQGQSRQIARSSVAMIRLASASAATRPAARAGVLVGADGSTVAFAALSLIGGDLAVQSPTLGSCKVPLAQVAIIRFQPEGVTELADLTPASVRERGFFQTTFSHRLNRSAAGRPIRLGKRQFRTGLGLHSFCELTYRLDGQYSAFAAVVGIDDAVRPHGDATLVFLGDGKPLGEPIRLTGAAEPQAVRIGLVGVKELTIRVDFGADGLDYADHVDLAGARLMK